MSANRRQSPRIQKEVSIRYVCSGGNIRHGTAVNISQTGARLRLGEADVKNLTVEFEGRVAVLARPVWECPLAEGEHEVGVEFEGFHWSQKVVLEHYLSELESRAA